MIRIVLVDDQTLVRQGIKSLLELTADLRVVAEASDGQAGLDAIARTKADLVLLDVRMPLKSGLEVLEGMKAIADAPPAILLTTFDDDAVAFAGIKLGARGFLLKDVSLEQLDQAIRTVAGGGTLISPAVTERVLRGVDRLATKSDVATLRDPLTRREIEVLRLIAAGSSNKEIADVLGAAEGTVKNHASSVFAKLGVRDRTRAVLRALELRLI